MLDQFTQKPRGYGYLNFHTKEEAQRCLDEQASSTLDGKVINLLKKKDHGADKEANIIVKNLPKEMKNDKLYSMFIEFGNIISSKIEENTDGTCKGFGFVQF